MTRILQITVIVLTFMSCNFNPKQTVEKNDKTVILSADRETPMGWVHLKIYQDSTFEFESAGLLNGEIYKGKAKITEELIQFNYLDSIPKAGQTAIYDKNTVRYIDGKYLERVKISFSSLSESIYDKISASQIKDIVQQSLDLPELQEYYHTNKSTKRLPIELKMSGLINPYTVQGIKKFENQIQLICQNSSKHRSGYWEFNNWSLNENILEFQLSYKEEGIIINYKCKKTNDNWAIEEAMLCEE